eukprot:9489622-Pyramimonas_sp.AAC.1
MSYPCRALSPKPTSVSLRTLAQGSLAPMRRVPWLACAGFPSSHVYLHVQISRMHRLPSLRPSPRDQQRASGGRRP